MTVLTPTKNTQGFPEMEGSSHFTAADFVRSVNKKVTARLVCLYSSSSLTSTWLPDQPVPAFFLCPNPTRAIFQNFWVSPRHCFQWKKVEFWPIMWLFKQKLWEHIKKLTLEKIRSNATDVTLHLLIYVSWGDKGKGSPLGSPLGEKKAQIQLCDVSSLQAGCLKTHLKCHSK